MDQIVLGLAVGAAYSLMAVGVAVIYRCTRALSIAQGEIGAFGFFYGLQASKGKLTLGIPFTPVGWHVPKVPAFFSLVIAVLIAAGIALLVERFVMRALVQRPPLDGLIATLGIALFLALAELRIFGTAPQPAPSPVGTYKLTILGAPLIAPRITALAVAVLAVVGVLVFFNKTKFGLAVLATTSDPTVAKILGVPVNRVYQFAWVLGGVLSGLAAALLAPSFGSLVAFGQTRFALAALAGAVVGGLDSIEGAILGSLLVGVVQTVVGYLFDPGTAFVAILVLVLGTLIARPRGILGTAGVA